MKRSIIASEVEIDVDEDTFESLKAEEGIDDDFSRRWNENFGEPSTKVYTREEFLSTLKEMIEFE